MLHFLRFLTNKILFDISSKETIFYLYKYVIKALKDNLSLVDRWKECVLFVMDR